MGEPDYIQMIAKNNIQSKFIVKTILPNQLKKIQEIARQIQSKKIPISDHQYKKLQKDKKFIIKLIKGNTTSSVIKKHFETIQIISKIAIQNGKNAKGCTSTSRRMGKIKKKTIRFKQNKNSYSSSSDESEFDTFESGRRGGERRGEKHGEEEEERENRETDTKETSSSN